MEGVFAMILAYCNANSQECFLFKTQHVSVLYVCVPEENFKIFGNYTWIDGKKNLTVANCDVGGAI